MKCVTGSGLTPNSSIWKYVHLHVDVRDTDFSYHPRNCQDVLIDFINQARNSRAGGGGGDGASSSSKSNQSHQCQCHCQYVISQVTVLIPYVDCVRNSKFIGKKLGPALNALEGVEKVLLEVELKSKECGLTENVFLPSLAGSITHLPVYCEERDSSRIDRAHLSCAMVGFSKLQKLKLSYLDADLVTALLCPLAPKTLIINDLGEGEPEHLFNHQAASAIEVLQVTSESIADSAEKATAFTQALLSRNCNLKVLAIDQEYASNEGEEVIEIFRQCFQHQSTIQEVHIYNGRHSLLPSALIHTLPHDANDASDTPAPIERRLTYSGDLSCLNFPSLVTSNIRLESLSIEDFEVSTEQQQEQTKTDLCNWLESSSCPLKHLEINLSSFDWDVTLLVAIKGNSSLLKMLETLQLHGLCESREFRDQYAIPVIKILKDILPKMKRLHTLFVYPGVFSGPAIAKPGVVKKLLQSLAKNKTVQEVSVMPALGTKKQQEEIQSICQHNQLSHIIRTTLQDSSQPFPPKHVLAKLVGGKEKNSTAFISLCFLSLSEYGGGLSDFDRAKSLCMFFFTLKEQDYNTWVELDSKRDDAGGSAGVQTKHVSDCQKDLLEVPKTEHEELVIRKKKDEKLVESVLSALAGSNEELERRAARLHNLYQQQRLVEMGLPLFEERRARLKEKGQVLHERRQQLEASLDTALAMLKETNAQLEQFQQLT